MAGIIAAKADNGFCGVGIAYNAKIGGILLLDPAQGRTTEQLEADALSFKNDYIDIYVSGWGPSDQGNAIDGPGPLVQAALENAVNNGRQGRQLSIDNVTLQSIPSMLRLFLGKGSIIVWASGSGGGWEDHCNADGYTTSIYTMSFGSVAEDGDTPFYAEPCSSTLAVTYSSGSRYPFERKIITSDLNDKCTNDFSGTSASAAMATGILALALEANRNLTWRDMQHLVVRTSVPRGHLNVKNVSFSQIFHQCQVHLGKRLGLQQCWTSVL